MNIPLHPKLRGEWAEVKFLARASELGLHVSKPYGDSLPYDFIVEHGGRMFRVQVKATTFKRRDHAGYMCRIAPNHSAGYADEVLDFIAAYVIPEDVWYIIPFPELVAKVAVNLDPGREANRYRQYREAWDLLLVETPSEVARLKLHPSRLRTKS